ncbi:acyltransferase-domain-containing protein [Phycomyces nitens]|nr:acyltransferase-domain-containing protein [Phycomyces nitens]
MRPLLFLRPGRLVKFGSVTASASVAYYVFKKHTEDQKSPAALTAVYTPPPFDWETIPGFIKKRFEPPYPANSMTWNVFSSLVMGCVGSFGKLFIYCLNDTHTHNMEPALAIIDQENRSRGLITVSNHASVWDDPFLWGVLPTKTLFSVTKMRWVLGAADICYTSLFKSLFFSLGQGIPTMRGAGVYQPAVDFAIHKMDQHQWIHIFPEARVNQGDDLIRFKWGIGRIVMEAKECPIIIPVWHKGKCLKI